MGSRNHKPNIFVVDKYAQTTFLFLKKEFGFELPTTTSEHMQIAPILKSLDELIKSTGQASIPLQIGKEIFLEDYGFLGYAAKSCQNVGQALKMNVLYLSSVSNAISFQYSESKDLVCVSFECHLDDLALEQYLVEIWLSGLYTLLNQLVPGIEPNVIVHLPYSKPEHVDEYQKYGKPNLLFDQPGSCMFLTRATMDQSIGTCDPKLQALAEMQLQEMVEAHKQETFYSDEVKRFLLQSRYNESLLHIADRLHISERTLKRYLADEKTSFRQLLKESRYENASRMLITGNKSVDQIAALLGYSTAANFCQAFKQWSGCSPTEYREKVLPREF